MLSETVAEHWCSRKLAMVCGVNAFNLSDLTRPEPVRLRTVLSGIMNFAKFRYVLVFTNARRIADEEPQGGSISLQGHSTAPCSDTD